MSATLPAIARPVAIKISDAYLRILNAAWERLVRHFEHRAAIARLRELDARALDDIGLARSDIEPVVRGFITARNRVTIS